MTSTTILPRDRAALMAEIKAGRVVSGRYDLGPNDPPIVLFNPASAIVGDPVRGVQIHRQGGTAIIAGWAEPVPPPELWTADGGLRLMDAANRPWRLSFPFAAYSQPGKGPKLWAGLTSVTWTLDFRLDKYLGPQGFEPIPLFSCMEATGQPSPIMAATQGERLTVYLRDSEGTKVFQAMVLDGTPGARNKIAIKVEGDVVTISGTKGTPLVGAIKGPLAENDDSVFQFGCWASSMFSGPFAQPGAMTVYGFSLGYTPAMNHPSEVVALTLPKPGEWWALPGGILHCQADFQKSWAAGPSHIENVEITADGDRTEGAGVLLGANGAGLKIRNVIDNFHGVGLGSMGSCWVISIDGFTGYLNSVAGLSLYNCIVDARGIRLDRYRRDGYLFRGGDINLSGGMSNAGGFNGVDDRRASWRLLAFDDFTKLSVASHREDDEGTQPTEAHIVADASKCIHKNIYRITFRDCTFAEGAKFAKLKGAPAIGQAAYLKLDNVTSHTVAPTMDVSSAWVVDGLPIGVNDVVRSAVAPVSITSSAAAVNAISTPTIPPPLAP